MLIQRYRIIPRLVRQYSSQSSKESDVNMDHGEYGTAEKFTQHWSTFFASAPDLFELQRGLNNCFNYDLVPPAPVIEQALLACRRLNSFATAVRIFGGLRGKVSKGEQYDEYVKHFRPMMDAAGIVTPEELGRFE